MSRKSHGISVFPRRRLLTSLVSFQARNSRHAQFPNGEFPIKGDTQRKVLPYGVWLCLCRRIEFSGVFVSWMASTCPPGAGRYMERELVLAQTLKPRLYSSRYMQIGAQFTLGASNSRRSSMMRLWAFKWMTATMPRRPGNSDAKRMSRRRTSKPLPSGSTLASGNRA